MSQLGSAASTRLTKTACILEFPGRRVPGTNHLRRLEMQIDFSKFRVHLKGGFNLPGVDWLSEQITRVNSDAIMEASRLINFARLNGPTRFDKLENVAGNVFDLFLSNCPIDMLVRPNVFTRLLVCHFLFPEGRVPVRCFLATRTAT